MFKVTIALKNGLTIQIGQVHEEYLKILRLERPDDLIIVERIGGD